MKIYLDACCLNRLTDDQRQTRIRDEAEAVEGILRLVQAGGAIWVSSRVLAIETGRNPDLERRHDVLTLLEFANEVVVPQAKDAVRAESLERLGFGEFDALHLACAELGAVDVFLTTDDYPGIRNSNHAIPLRSTTGQHAAWPAAGGARGWRHSICGTT